MPPSPPPIVSLASWPKKFVTPLQLARYTGVPIRTVYYHIELGVIATVVRVRRRLITVAEAAKYAAEPLPDSASNTGPNHVGSVQSHHLGR